jgi:hypothetical protein
MNTLPAREKRIAGNCFLTTCLIAQYNYGIVLQSHEKYQKKTLNNQIFGINLE